MRPRRPEPRGRGTAPAAWSAATLVVLGAASGLGAARAAAPESAMPLRPGAANPPPPLLRPAGRAARPTSALPLPQPLRPDALPVPGTTADRLRHSRAPGPVAIDDAVDVALAPDGTPAAVVDTERLVVAGVGDYAVYERGPARRAVALGDAPPPVAKLGTVVWEGFSPGRRELGAALTLDPGLEALRLPVTVRLRGVDGSGRAVPLQPGGGLAGATAVEVTVTDQTSAPQALPTGAAAAPALARLGEALQDSAAHPGRRPPAAGRELPAALPADGPVGQRLASVSAALHVSGSITAPCASGPLSGPGVTPSTGGGAVAGTLDGGAVGWRLPVSGACALQLRLEVRPGTDRRSCAPPAGARTWVAWAAGRPSPAARAAATDELMAGLASAARAAGFYPYLQPDVPGTASGAFRYALAPATAAAPAARTTRTRPGAVVAAVAAALLAAGNGALLRRRL